MTWSESLLILLLLAPPAFAGGDAYQRLVTNYGLMEKPGIERFNVCHSHGCDGIETVGLTPAQWQQVVDLFAEPADDAATERERIAQAIALMEELVGRLAGTGDDRGGNLKGFASNTAQQDCVDESTNTTTYLTLLADNGLLRWHRVREPAMRGFIFMGWPHLTAVVVDKDSGQEWAVDSWFYDNGTPPAIVPLAKWRGGWKPADFESF